MKDLREVEEINLKIQKRETIERIKEIKIKRDMIYLKEEIITIIKVINKKDHKEIVITIKETKIKKRENKVLLISEIIVDIKILKVIIMPKETMIKMMIDENEIT